MRFSILTLLGLVAVAAIGIAALLKANEAWAEAISNMVVAALAASIAAGLILARQQRAFAIGFAVVGVSFFVLTFLPQPHAWMNPLVSERGLRVLHNSIRKEFNVTTKTTIDGNTFTATTRHVRPKLDCFLQVGNMLSVLLIALVGGLIARYSYWLRQKQESAAAASDSPEVTSDHGST